MRTRQQTLPPPPAHNDILEQVTNDNVRGTFENAMQSSPDLPFLWGNGKMHGISGCTVNRETFNTF
ncbi:MAG: hypothetical protein GY820_46995 [Gammaproteobacteria bacterium]|nr:hypothetical protein [Gammaproteobacteria bacterium]